MPLFIDVHPIEGEVAATDPEQAHAPDPQVQGGRAGSDELFWIGQKAGETFWLVEASSVQAAHAVHQRTHGPVTSRIYEVQPGSPWFSGGRNGGRT